MTTIGPRERMLADLPVATRTLDIGGVSTAVIEAGNGPPLLLLHGGIECGGAMWAHVLTQLAKHHRVVVPDVPGLGESSPVPRLDVDTFARWLTGLAEQTGLERPTLVAHSLIDSLAARFAAGGSDLISRLNVYAAPGVGSCRMPLRLRYVAIRFAIHPSARNAERFDRFALLDLATTRRRDPAWYDAFDAHTRAPRHRTHVKKTMHHRIATQTKAIGDAELARIQVPTTLIWGRYDRMVPLALVAVRAGLVGGGDNEHLHRLAFRAHTARGNTAAAGDVIRRLEDVIRHHDGLAELQAETLDLIAHWSETAPDQLGASDVISGTRTSAIGACGRSHARSTTGPRWPAVPPRPQLNEAL
jgi:pimeloyl-ACP methyl ester carboxylesterase